MMVYLRQIVCHNRAECRLMVYHHARGLVHTGELPYSLMLISPVLHGCTSEHVVAKTSHHPFALYMCCIQVCSSISFCK